MSRRAFFTGFVAALLAVLLVGLLWLLFVAYAGSYNIAASEDHSPFVRWTFDTTMKNAVSRQAADIEPPVFSDAMTRAGAREYKAMCQQCHGGPGVDPDAFSRGMLPQPPHLHEVAGEWEDREIFWLVKHGVKMTGMPAFGHDHDDRAIWEIAAFVSKLPGMTAEDYAAYESGHGDGHHE